MELNNGSLLNATPTSILDDVSTAVVLYASHFKFIKLRTGGNTGLETTIVPPDALSSQHHYALSHHKVDLELSSWLTEKKQVGDEAHWDPLMGDGLRRMCAERATVASQWILDTFGVHNLRMGSGVLDVAGGRGELSALLSLHGIHSTVIDPR